MYSSGPCWCTVIHSSYCLKSFKKKIELRVEDVNCQANFFTYFKFEKYETEIIFFHDEFNKNLNF